MPIPSSRKPEQLLGDTPNVQGWDTTMDTHCYVGIDVSKDRLDIHIRPLDRSAAIANNKAGFTELAEMLATLDVRKVIMEASGGYEHAAFLALVEAGLPVAIVNPRQVRNFAKGAGRTAKTDTIDAAMLAHFAEVFQPRDTVPPSALEAELAEYLIYRGYLIRETINLKNQLRRLTLGPLRTSINDRLTAAKVECRIAEAKMVALVQASPAKAELFKLLVSVPGVGSLLACLLIANLRELGNLTRREIASLVGVAPMNNDSGLRRGRRFIGGGRGAIRTVLYMATLTAARFNTAIRLFYERLRNAGKPAKVALTACMRKLLTTLNAMVRDGQSWNQAKCA